MHRDPNGKNATFKYICFFCLFFHEKLSSIIFLFSIFDTSFHEWETHHHRQPPLRYNLEKSLRRKEKLHTILSSLDSHHRIRIGIQNYEVLHIHSLPNSQTDSPQVILKPIFPSS